MCVCVFVFAIETKKGQLNCSVRGFVSQIYAFVGGGGGSGGVLVCWCHFSIITKGRQSVVFNSIYDNLIDLPVH